MISLFRKPKPVCDHVWYKALQRTETTEILLGGQIVDYEYESVYLFCPKCDSTKSVYPEEWEVIEATQKVKAEWVKGRYD